MRLRFHSGRMNQRGIFSLIKLLPRKSIFHLFKSICSIKSQRGWIFDFPGTVIINRSFLCFIIFNAMLACVNHSLPTIRNRWITGKVFTLESLINIKKAISGSRSWNSLICWWYIVSQMIQEMMKQKKMVFFLLLCASAASTASFYASRTWFLMTTNLFTYPLIMPLVIMITIMILVSIIGPTQLFMKGKTLSPRLSARVFASFSAQPKDAVNTMKRSRVICPSNELLNW